ncbi:MAG: DUF362 domain-containing protein [Candidatus Micrarchaeota archaeon]|nr:DUF362 domain-containing protein [Candidatus Micrarchaeota archaeon]
MKIKQLAKHLIRKLKHNHLFFLLALAFWFIFRVGEKPNRITYPCQQPFLAYLGVLFLPLGYKNKIKEKLTTKNIAVFSVLLLVFVSGFFIGDLSKQPEIIFVKEPAEKLFFSGPYPHRVVSVHDSTATTWNFSCEGSCPYYGSDSYINQNSINSMVDNGLMQLTGTSSAQAAWQTLIPNFQPGQKIAIKVNFNAADGYGDTDTQIDATPQPMIALIRGLKTRGFAEQNIWIYDASRHITNRYRNEIFAHYPNIQYYVCPTCGDIPPNVHQTTYNSTNPTANINFHTTGHYNKKLPDEVVNADYLIDMPIIKAHSIAGITLSFKNHMGTALLEHSYIDPEQGNYSPNANPLVEMYENTNIRDKTILILGDGIYGGFNYSHPIRRWISFGNNAPKTLFFSTDPVAIDSVMFDYLKREDAVNGEFNIKNGAGDILQVAENAGLGIYEHWNNNNDRDYATIDYIELDFDSGCQENWQCSAWSSCVNGQKTRTCNDLAGCGTEINKPAETQACECNNGEIRYGCTTSEGCPGTETCSSETWGLCEDIPDDGCPATIGTINVTHLAPLGNLTVTQNQSFTYKTQVNCVGGNCGNISAILDPIFGYNIIGIGNDNTVANEILISKFTAPENGTIQSMTAYLSGGSSVIFVIYSETGNLMAQSSQVVPPNTWNWIEGTINLQVTAGTKYWFGWIQKDGLTWRSWDVDSQVQGANFLSSTVFPALPSTISGFPTNNRKLSIYATYTTGAGNTKGTIPVGSGNPFYTNSNPQNFSLLKGETFTNTWNVTPTGNPGQYNFFVKYQPENTEITPKNTSGRIITIEEEQCIENWQCEVWSACVNGQQTRTCNDLADCGTTEFKPAESQACGECINGETQDCDTDQGCDGIQLCENNYWGDCTDVPEDNCPCEENWSCTAWSECVNGNQTRTCIDQAQCGTTENKPYEIQDCSECTQGQTRNCTTTEDCDGIQYCNGYGMWETTCYDIEDNCPIGTCAEGELITEECFCGSQSYSTGYCCEGTHQETSCPVNCEEGKITIPCYCGTDLYYDGYCCGTNGAAPPAHQTISCESCTPGTTQNCITTEDCNGTQTCSSTSIWSACVDNPTDECPVCIPEWTCTPYSECVDNQKTRTCTDNNDCGTEENKPSTSQACGLCDFMDIQNCNTDEGCTGSQVCDVTGNWDPECYDNDPDDNCPECIEEWSCTAWNDCINGTKNRTCTDTAECNTTEFKPSETQACGECINGETKNCSTNQGCAGTQTCSNNFWAGCNDVPNDNCPTTPVLKEFDVTINPVSLRDKQSFTITVKSIEGQTIPGIKTEYAGATYHTDSNGRVVLKAKKEFTKLTLSKTGYTAQEIRLAIYSENCGDTICDAPYENSSNCPQDCKEETKQLIVTTAIEGKTLTVKVKDEKENNVADAEITYNTKTKLTDSTGTVVFALSEKTQDVFVLKTGYEPKQIEVFVPCEKDKTKDCITSENCNGIQTCSETGYWGECTDIPNECPSKETGIVDAMTTLILIVGVMAVIGFVLAKQMAK